MPPLLLKLIFDRIGSGQGCRSSRSRSRAASPPRCKALMIEPNLKRQLDFMEGELDAQRVVRRRRVQRRRHPDELPGRGRGAARRPRREPAEADDVPEEDPRPARVPARARARRARTASPTTDGGRRVGALSAASCRWSATWDRSVPPGAPAATRRRHARRRRRRRSGPASSPARRHRARGLVEQRQHRALDGGRERDHVLAAVERQLAARIGAVRQEEADGVGLRLGIGEVAGQQHPLQRHPRHLRAAARRREVGELRQLVEPPFEGGPVARSQRLLEAHRQAAVVVVERGARQMARDFELAAEARHEDVGVERFERAERQRARLQLAAVEPADEDPVEADGARVRVQLSMRKTSWRTERGSLSAR